MSQLGDAIRSRASVTEEGQVYFGSGGDFGVFDQVAVLRALGETNQLTGVDQVNALTYLNEFQRDHDEWGTPAGKAYGISYTPKDSELTARAGDCFLVILFPIPQRTPSKTALKYSNRLLG